jgi:uroporphyrinogen decarboxylase
MTPRERILTALAHKEPDRLPIDFGGTDCSSIHVLAYDKLRKAAGIEPRPMRLGCMMQQIAEVDTELLDFMGSDAQGLYFHPKQWRRWESGYGFPVEVADTWRPEDQPDGSTVVRNAAGGVQSRRTAGGYYFDPQAFTLAHIEDVSEIPKYEALFTRWDWPAVLDESLEEYSARAKAAYLATDRAVAALWQNHYLQAGQVMRGYEQFMIDLLTDEAMARGIFDRLHEVYMARTRLFLDVLGDSLDIVFLTDDLGTQQGPLIGPELYRSVLKPYWAEQIALIKSRGKKVVMHACGAVSDFIPDMIEMGVDALNPVQIAAQGMAPERLKREFGADIAFWGGGVNTQGVLDIATPQQVREHVRRTLDTFAPGGGYVFTQVHNIQANVPAANILAAYEAAREY